MWICQGMFPKFAGVCFILLTTLFITKNVNACQALICKNACISVKALSVKFVLRPENFLTWQHGSAGQCGKGYMPFLRENTTLIP
jgi:hypothetical protein